VKGFLTLQGARRHRREIGGCIIRILADPDEIFVVAPSFLQTKIMSVDEDGRCDGVISLSELTMRGQP
jgi:hypothetical protein